VKPSFYALERGGWRDYVTLLHVPYTAWHLSYVVVGGCLAASVSWNRMGLTVLAFFLAMGIGAHALDELADRPLGTAIPSSALVALALVSIAAACAIGIAVALRFSLWILPLVAVGAFLVPAYNLELFDGRFHSDIWFAVAWGAFPVLTGYVACEGSPRLVAFVAAGWATALSLAQRRLSTPVRRVRREVVSVDGELGLTSGDREPITRELLVSAPEGALRLLTIATVLIAAALVTVRL
jgi:heme O synthase-like polyprenyltransferase